VKRVAFSVLFLYGARAAGALALAAPATALVAASGLGNFPAGDRLLFERGGLLLVEVVRASWSFLPPLATSTLVTAALVYAALALPGALLWTPLAEETPDPTPVFLGRACARVPAYFALSAAGLLARILVLSVGLTAAGMLHGRSSPNALRADLGALAALLLAGALALSAGLIRDVACATVACGARDSKSALRAALRVVARRPLAAAGRCFGPTALALALVVLAALATGSLDVGRPEASRFVAVAVLHQLVALGVTVCRAVWLKSAVRLVRPQLAGGSAARR
jgi:hypothetical protein